MASVKGLNPFAAEFKSQTRFAFSNSPLPAPLIPYGISFYSFSSVLTASTCFSSSPTYSIPFPSDFPYPTYFEQDLFPAIEPTFHQTELDKVQQQNHVSAVHESTQEVFRPKVPKTRGSNRGYRRYSRFFDKPIGISSNTLKQEWKPAMKSERNVPHKCVDYNCTPRRVVKRFSDVLPVLKDGDGTTVMIRNIPNKYTRDLLLTFLDNHCAKENQKSDGEESESESAFDFLYLPIDFCTGMNKGYAFVNFTTPKAVWKFFLAAHCQTWDSFHSNKIREIAYARMQGKEDLVEHFETMRFPCESENVLPVCFSPPRDGSEKLVERILVGKLERWNGIGLKGQAGTWKKVKEGSSEAS